MADAVHVLVVRRVGEAADLADHALGPVPHVALAHAGLRHPDAPGLDDVGHDAQALALVGPPRVVAAHGQPGPLQVLYQTDARRLVLDQQQVHALLLAPLAVHGLVLVDDLGPQVGVGQLLLPAVDHHHAHAAVQRLEHAQRDVAGRVAGLFVLVAAVVALDHVLEAREGLAVRPQPEPVPVDNPAFLGVNDLCMYLLPTKVGALVLQDLLLERWG